MSEPVHAMPAPAPIPAPPDFPIEWPAPEMAMTFWQQDRMHMPNPGSPMSSWLAEQFAAGFTSGLGSYGVPMGVQTTRLNTYYYMAIGPTVPPEMMPELMEKAAPNLMAGVGNFWQRWESEWLPELKRGWAEFSALDYPKLPDQELLAFVARARSLYERAWHIHFELLVPAFVGTSTFQDVYMGLFPDKSELDAYRLLQGFDSMSLEAGRKLWELSRVAKADATVRAILDSTSARDVPAALERSDEGRAFLTRVNEYTAFYGRRSDTVQELDSPSWTEDPTPVIDNIKAYVGQDDDPAVAHQKLATERERHVAEARTAIANQPAEVRGQFEVLLAAGQGFTRVQEDHNFWIDQRSLHEVRHLCLDIGRRLQERGQIRAAADVFMFRMEEATALLTSPSTDGKTTVVERRAEMARWAKISAPPVAGTDYGPPPPEDPIAKAIGRFFGAPPAAAPTRTEVTGNAGSPGKVTGIARVILTIADAGRLGEGEILVTPTTAPPWTPFFATAAAVVTETGGVLSHCAIVAREYGIPAVVGAAGVTAIVKDGARIEVDGDKGVVRMLS